MAWLMLVVGSAVGQHFVTLGGEIDSVRVLPKLGADSAYLVNESLTVKETGTLTIEAGSKIYFMQSAGLRVDGGMLLLEGSKDDSISLLCYEFSHDWDGLQLKNIGDGNATRLSHVMGALTAISATNCTGASIRHCSFNNFYAGKGIELIDCNDFVIDSCFFSNCVSGIELKARSGGSRGNWFMHSVFDYGQINVEVSNVGYGYKCDDNHIVGNCFQGATTAISFETVGGISDKDAKNFIEGNLISSSIPEGSMGYSSFGVKAAMDSLVIKNNVFWHNDEAISMTKVCHLLIEGNTFYHNGSVLTNLLRSGSARVVGNTLSEIQDKAVVFASDKAFMHNNNFVHPKLGEEHFINASADDVDMRWNFWHTHSEQSIGAMIYDHDDQSTLGRIVYDGFRPECDTANPLSPPFRVKRQLVGGSWLVSWDENPESDIDHYVLFYGGFNHYKFDRHIDSIAETHHLLAGQQIGDVAVMACDRAYNPDVYASKGQSAYAFASYYPYAGGDDYLCAPQEGYAVEGANIPYTYNRFSWRSSGSGTFSDSLALQTVYYPSESDFEEGSVRLTLHVLSGGVEKTDEMQLKLYKQLEVFAGDDYYSGLNRPVVTGNAATFNSDSIRWHSLGDGHFDDNEALHAVYHLGERDIALKQIELVIEAWSFCGYATDTVRYELYEEFSLGGRVWSGGQPHPRAQVVAASRNNGNPFFSGFYRTMTDEEGRFSFEALLADTYILYAFPDTLQHRASGSYYHGDWLWSESNMIDVVGNVSDVDLELPAVAAGFSDGLCIVEGCFEMPETNFRARDFYCQPWLRADDETEYCSDGLSNVGVMLLNGTKQRVLGFALTDAEGRFRFSGLPFGTYFIVADLPRYGRGCVQQITLSPEQPAAEGLRLFIDDRGKVVMRCQSDGTEPKSLAAVPNPTSGNLTINGLQALESYAVSVCNVTGSLVMPQCSMQADMIGELSIDVTHLADGIYCIVLNGGSGIVMLKFAKY